MSRGKLTRKRRHRRQFKQALKFGPSAKPTHKLKSGRTGSVHTKKIKSLDFSKGERGKFYRPHLKAEFLLGPEAK